MLQQLTIRQIALIDEATITFHPGFQALTGETGAGKSIVVDAVNLILGGRADRELIRSGSDKASVEAVFEVADNPAIRDFMSREAIDFDGQTVTVYRELSQSGRNLCRVCGVLIPVARLKALAALLMDLHGQSEHQFLVDPEMHLHFLDQTGDDAHQKLLLQVSDACAVFLENHRAYAKLVKKNENREERLERLARDLEELRSADLQPGEAEQLLRERKRLQSLETEASVLQSACDALSASEEGTSALGALSSATAALRSLKSDNPDIEKLKTRCEGLCFELEETAYELSALLNRSDFDPRRLEQIDARLEQIHHLERRLKTPAEKLPALRATLEQEYEELRGLADRVTEMAAEHRRLLAAYRGLARELTASRRSLAAAFEQRMMAELKDLGMEKTKFEVCFIPREEGRPLMPSESGDDRVEFMISPNPGEPLKPLAKIASGGELSRLMLAIKSLEAAHTGVESMVFDEIDTGISGRMAQVVAEKMAQLAATRQIICVTHLPQIAAAANNQYLVRKAVRGDRTHTSVTELDFAGRTEEVARMISGAEGITPESVAYAKTLLRTAE